MKIISIYFGHNATVTVLLDGKIVFSQSEERFNRLKNSCGFPVKTLEYVLKQYGDAVDYVVFPVKSIQGYKALRDHFKFQSARVFEDFKVSRRLAGKYLLKFLVWKFFRRFYIWLYRRNYERRLLDEGDDALVAEAMDYFSSTIGVPKEKILFLDHHTAHALSPCFNLPFDRETLIFTLDGEGDELCATVNIYQNGSLERLSAVHKFNSLGYLWYELTGFMGMRPVEDEYKIMGLAPYAKRVHAEKAAAFFKDIIKLNDRDEFEASFPVSLVNLHHLDRLMYHRFDTLAGGIQLFTEEIVSEWVRRWVKKTGIADIACAGGLFMNVKLDQKIAELDEVKSIFVMPSAGDESSTFGAALYGYKRLCEERSSPFSLTPLADLYLGTEHANKEIEAVIQKLALAEKFSVKKCDTINSEVAALLASGGIVARFSGRMEFGARALGNRSILAHPSKFDTVRVINEAVKNRDFWMPFASSILAEDEERYIKNPKHISAPYMILTFDTTALAREHLAAAIHPYDFTTRPQIVTRAFNPEYHSLITEFKKLTGIGGILNTSFNLHGEPVVESPEDAISSFERSGLTHLALGDYLISKR